jgi:hypothetical protein
MSADPRDLMLGRTTAALGASLDGAPYVSLVLAAFDCCWVPLETAYVFGFFGVDGLGARVRI